MITISGVSGTGQAGPAIGVGAESIVVALYADNNGIPGAFISFLGTVNDSDVSDSGLISLDVSLDLDGDSRYWIALIGGSDTRIGWVQATNDDGQGVPGEYWVALGEDPVSNAFGAYQFAILEAQIGVSAVGSAGVLHTGLDAAATIAGVEATGQAEAVSTEITGYVVVSLYSDNDGTPGSLIAVIGTVSDDEITDTNLVSFDVDSLNLDGSSRYWIVVTGSSQTRIAWVQAASDTGQGVASEYWVSLSTPISDYLLAEDGSYLLLEDGAFTGLQEVVPNAEGPSYQFAILDQHLDVVAVGSAGEFAHEIIVPLADVEGVGQAGLVSFAGVFLAAVTGVAGHGIAGSTTTKIDARTIGRAGTGLVGSIGAEIAGSLVGTSATGDAGGFVEEQVVAISGIATQGDAEDLAVSIEVTIDGVIASTAVTQASTQIITGLQGVAGDGQCGSPSTATPVSIAISGVVAGSVTGSLTDVVTVVLSAASATGHVGTITPSQISSVNVTISGVGAEGAVGKLPGKRKRVRGGRGGATKFTPALFSVPEVPETDAEKLARYRKIVDDLLELPPRDEDDEEVDKLPPRQDGPTGQPEPEEYVPDFTFLKSLEKGEGVEDLAITDEVPLGQWHVLALEEDRLLLGDVQSDDELLLNLLQEEEF